MATDNKQIAVDVLMAVGGKKNVVSAQHCMTRLRLVLKDETIVDDEAVKAVKGAIGVQRAGGQYQIIIGQNVPKVYDAFCAEADIAKQDAIDENLDVVPQQKLTLKQVGSNILNYLSGSLIQLIPILMAAGLFKTVASVFGPSFLGILAEDSNLYILCDFVYDAGFYYIPIYLGYTAAKKIGASPALGMFMGGILIAPDFIAMAGSSFTVYGIPTTAYSYTQTVLPILLSVAALYFVEKFFKKVMPDTLSTIFTPFCTIAVMLPISLCLLAPLGNYCSGLVTAFLSLVDQLTGFVGYGIIAGVWEFLVMTGMHAAIIPIMIAELAQTGSITGAFVGLKLATVAVWGVSLGAFFRIKSKDEKALTLGYLVSGVIGGVTEPALYGLCFKYRRMFIGVVVGGFVGGLVAGIGNLTMYLYGPSSILGILSYTGGSTANLAFGAASWATTFVVSALCAYFLGFSKDELAAMENAA